MLVVTYFLLVAFYCKGKALPSPDSKQDAGVQSDKANVTQLASTLLGGDARYKADVDTTKLYQVTLLSDLALLTP